MSCGTPVIATNDGAISEIVIHSKTGFICKSTEEMIQSISKLSSINSEECYKRAEEFDRIIMAKNYVKLYQRILNNDEW
jgi:glycosyltransferase involved in cell wall biosynthesis